MIDLKLVIKPLLNIMVLERRSLIIAKLDHEEENVKVLHFNQVRMFLQILTILWIFYFFAIYRNFHRKYGWFLVSLWLLLLKLDQFLALMWCLHQVLAIFTWYLIDVIIIFQNQILQQEISKYIKFIIHHYSSTKVSIDTLWSLEVS